MDTLFHIPVSVALVVLCLLTGHPCDATDCADGAAPPPSAASAEANTTLLARRTESLRLAIQDLIDTFPAEYSGGAGFLARLEALPQTAAAQPDPRALARLQREALMANPLLRFERLIVLKRKRGQLGLPTNHQCNTSLPQLGYDNEIAWLTPADPAGELHTLYRPDNGAFVGELDLDFAAQRLLFTMPNGRTWQIHEIGVDAAGLRPVSREVPGVDHFDACYLPDGRIVFVSTASLTGVPCWHGQERACCIYSMRPDGSEMRQLCFDQDLDLHPSVLSNGQVIFSRWDYTGIMHVYLRPLMVMNPDGTMQRAVYGSNSYFPNALYFPRAVPGAPTKLVAVLSGYHGTNRTGELVVIDTAQGWQEADGILQRIGHRGEPVVPIIRDDLVSGSWPKFLHPFPLSEKYFLVAAQIDSHAPWGIYLVDVFDNMVPLALQPEYDFFEPIPVQPRVRPPVIPDRVDLSRDDATVYLHNVYAGPGLAGVPTGSVKRLRVVAYHYGYPGLAGPDLIGRAGPWEAMRILGTVPVHPDGSAFFRVPASTPLMVQPLDAQGRALALMRSWYTAMPGEQASCVGCHEPPRETPVVRADLAARQPPAPITPWYGPPRGFDFEREVQPVLDRFCVGCHDGWRRADGRTIPDLRGERHGPDYAGLPLSQLGASRLDDGLRSDGRRFAPCAPAHELLGDRRTRYTRSYEILARYIRRVNVEDYVGLHVPCEYHASTSELVQMLEKGHHNVTLDAEAWDRLYTWIDLNGPCHGRWSDVAPIPGGADRRRRELAVQFGGPAEDGESMPPLGPISPDPVVPPPESARHAPTVRAPNWPCDTAEAQQRQRSSDAWERTVDLGQGVSIRLVRIPAGSFVMGSASGDRDEFPPTSVAVSRDFWMSDCEITNEQFQRFAPHHSSGYFMKRSLNNDGPGIAMNGPRQPVVRVSWQQAMEFCGWLSARTGDQFSLPSESQWEYACRAGTGSDLNYGAVDDDFSPHANLADAALQRIYTFTGGLVVLQDFPVADGYDDGAIATADVRSYAPNAWGLFDMHGNVAEWTVSRYQPYPYRDDEGRHDELVDDERVVRGGSYHDRPPRCRSSFRLHYPAWQRVHNVGFRIVQERVDQDW